MLKGKSGIVTGSTSGIGLGIATAFAAEGADVMPNGFGDPGQIEALRHEVEALTVFLCSDGAASMTAAALAMDGGWTQH